MVEQIVDLSRKQRPGPGVLNNAAESAGGRLNKNLFPVENA